MARTVEDAAVLLGVMAGYDPDDPATSGAKSWENHDYTQYLKTDGLAGARIGVARNFFGFQPSVDQVMETAIDILKSNGAELIDPADVDLPSEVDENELEVLRYEFKADLNAYLGRLGPEARVHTMEDVIEFNKQNKARVMPYFGQEQMEKAQAKGPLTEEAYQKALEYNLQQSRAEGIDAVLQEFQLDAIIAPTGGPAWLIDYVNGDSGDGGCSSPAAIAGYPHITVPAGYVQGLPVGISFFSTAFSEPVLLRLAYAFEQAAQIRRPPQFLKTTSITIQT
jgi:amidase